MHAQPTLEGISTRNWFPPHESQECPLCAEAAGRLTPAGAGTAGEIAVALVSSDGLGAVLRGAIARLARAIEPARVSLLVPESAAKWRVFASSADQETYDLVIDSDRYPELLETRRTSAPFVVPAVESAGELKAAREFLEQAGVKSLAAYPVLRASPAADHAVLKVSFYRPARPEELALTTLVAHLLVHRL